VIIYSWSRQVEFSAFITSVSHDPSEIILICWFTAQESLSILLLLSILFCVLHLFDQITACIRNLTIINLFYVPLLNKRIHFLILKFQIKTQLIYTICNNRVTLKVAKWSKQILIILLTWGNSFCKANCVVVWWKVTWIDFIWLERVMRFPFFIGFLRIWVSPL